MILGLKNHKTGIYINDKKFKSLSEMKGVYGKILSIYKNEEILNEEDEELIKGLLSYHPKFNEKMSNFKCFETGMHPDFKETKCFFIVRQDGTKEDFSYVKCIREIASKIKD